MQDAIARLYKVKMQWRSPHGKVKALMDAINEARLRLRAVRADHELFSKQVVIGSLGRKLQEDT